jgi:hypothetical protein
MKIFAQKLTVAQMVNKLHTSYLLKGRTLKLAKTAIARERFCKYARCLAIRTTQ